MNAKVLNTSEGRGDVDCQYRCPVELVKHVRDSHYFPAYFIVDGGTVQYLTSCKVGFEKRYARIGICATQHNRTGAN